MNMISTGAFQTEMDASGKRNELVTKLVNAWEKKNSKVARAGGLSLMALSLAACGSDDDTPFSQVDVDAAKTAATSAALTGSDGTVHATIDAAVTSNDTTIADTARAEGVASVDITTDNATATNTAVAADTAFASLAALVAAYNAAVATPAGTSLALTTANDVSTGGAGNDTFTATDTTYTANDVVTGGQGTDTMTITAAAGAGITAATSVAGVETVNVVVNSFDTETIDMANVVGAAINVSNAQLGGATSVTVNNLNVTSTLSVADTFTATLTVTGQGTVSSDAATVTATLGAAAGSMTINGDDSTNTVNLVAATAAAGTTTDSATINLAGTVAVDNEGGGNTVVENLTLSGNGAAASYDIADATTAGNTLETLTITGSQNVTVTASAAALGGIDAAADYSDTSTAGTTTVVMDTRATVDLSDVKADSIEFGVNGAGASTLTVANSQALALTADVNAGSVLTIDSTELTSGSETLNLSIENTQSANAMVVSDFEVVNLTIDDDSAATTTAQTITVAGLTGAAGTDINISSTLDNLTLTAVTADNIIATGMAGVLTVATTANVDGITGGSGADDVDHDADSALTFNGGAGADVLGVSAAQTNTTITFNGGAGNDTLSLETAQIVGDRYVLTDVEFIDTNNLAMTVDARDFTGQTLVITSTGGANETFNFDIANTTNVDLSGISGNEAQMAFASASATAIATTYSGTQLIDTITTGAGNDTISGNAGADIIDGAAGTDTINGGAGADSITGGAGNDTMSGGAGSDTFLFTQTAALNGSDTVSDFAVGTVASGGDVIDTSGFNVTIANANVGTAITLATATALATEGTTIAVADDEAYFAKVASTSTVDTVAELVTALTNGGELDAVDIAANADALVILGQDNGSTLFVYGVNNDGTAAIIASEVALLATITSSADVIDSFTTANIA
jgi:Ca2+-binding RTX toxin-like protein